MRPALAPLARPRRRAGAAAAPLAAGARAARASIVLLSGEAGIGKSRLAAALLDALPASRTSACATSARPTTPTARSIRSSASSSAPRASNATTTARRSSTSSRPCCRYGAAVGGRCIADRRAALPGRHRSTLSEARSGAAARRQRTLARSRAAGRGAVAPPADPGDLRGRRTGSIRPASSCSDRMIDEVPRLAILLLVDVPARLRPAVGRPAACHALALIGSTARQHGTRRSVRRQRGLPPDWSSEILDRTDGVPLFIEELTKAVVESGERCADAPARRSHPCRIAFPTTLQASLTSRLDRLARPRRWRRSAR